MTSKEKPLLDKSEYNTWENMFPSLPSRKDINRLRYSKHDLIRDVKIYAVDIKKVESALCVLKKKIRERCDVDGVPDKTIHANFTSRWKPIKEVFGEVNCEKDDGEDEGE